MEDGNLETVKENRGVWGWAGATGDGGASVRLSKNYVSHWANSGRWPANGLRERAVIAAFDRHGNLEDLSGGQPDGPALSALVEEAQVAAMAAGLLPEQITLPPDRAAASAREMIDHRADLFPGSMVSALEAIAAPPVLRP